MYNANYVDEVQRSLALAAAVRDEADLAEMVRPDAEPEREIAAIIKRRAEEFDQDLLAPMRARKAALEAQSESLQEERERIASLRAEAVPEYEEVRRSSPPCPFPFPLTPPLPMQSSMISTKSSKHACRRASPGRHSRGRPVYTAR